MPVEPDDLARWRRAHLVGIGGAGMCALAELLLGRGWRVSGSDVRDSSTTRRLVDKGAAVTCPHDADQVLGADVVVASGAVTEANVELARARELGLPVHRRGEFLAALARPLRTVAVAGSHGKTTTAGMVAAMLDAAGQSPSFAIGGELRNFDANGQHGVGPHFVAEADESDASFLHLRPDVAIVTNVDHDHMDAYGQDFARLRGAFADFLGRLPPSGAAIVCADDAAAAALAADLPGRAYSYGFNAGADFRGRLTPARRAGPRDALSVSRPEAAPLVVEAPLPGRDNARNMLAAIAAATTLGVRDEAIAHGLGRFGGVRRRFDIDETTLRDNPVTLVDDYGHHPAEIAGVIATARGLWPGRRLVMAFQPHRYTRLRDHLTQFAAVLASVDLLLILEVYAAFEAPIAGVHAAALAAAVADRGAAKPDVVAGPPRALEHLLEHARGGDVVLVQGAGDIDALASELRIAP